MSPPSPFQGGRAALPARFHLGVPMEAVGVSFIILVSRGALSTCPAPSGRDRNSSSSPPFIGGRLLCHGYMVNPLASQRAGASALQPLYGCTGGGREFVGSIPCRSGITCCSPIIFDWGKAAGCKGLRLWAMRWGGPQSPGMERPGLAGPENPVAHKPYLASGFTFSVCLL